MTTKSRGTGTMVAANAEPREIWRFLYDNDVLRSRLPDEVREELDAEAGTADAGGEADADAGGADGAEAASDRQEDPAG